ncbi:MAG: trigger factor [Proteobacteria bacterium]|nr:trigger factor [Pseudomonadota bacterium]
MKITENQVTGLIHHFNIIIPAAEIAQSMDIRLNKIGQTVQMPGFRKGKVPFAMLKQRYGRAALGEVVEEQVEKNVQKALTDAKIRPALKPKVTLEHFREGEDLTIKVSVEALPKIENLSIEGFTLENLKADVTDEEVDARIEKLRENTKLPTALKNPRSIQKGDIVYLVYSITLNKKVIDKKEGEGVPYTMGSNFFGIEFDKSLEGLKIGDTKTQDIVLPSPNYGKDSGKNAEITFTIKDIMVLESSNLEVLSKNNGFKDVEEFKKAVKDSIISHYDSYTRQNMKRQILDRLSQDHQFDVPAGLIDLEFDAIWKEHENFEKNKQQTDMKPLSQAEKEALQADYRKIAERRVRLGLLLAEIGIQNNIKVTNQELGKALYEYSMNYPEHQKEIIEYYRNNQEAMTAFQAPIFEEKVVDFIIQKSKLTDRKVSIEELIHLLEEDDENMDDGKCDHKGECGHKKLDEKNQRLL